MPPSRPASFTTFAILNIIFGGFFVLCGFRGLSDDKIEFNGKDVTQQYKDHMASEVPAYRAYVIGNVVVTEALAIGYIVAGIGLLKVAAWGRRLALICAGVAIGYEIFEAIYRLALVNPAATKFFATGPIQLGGGLSGIVNVLTVTVPVLSIVYNAVLLSLLMGKKAADAVRRVDLPDEYDEDDDEDRPRRRRPVRDEDEEERPRRKARRDEDEDEAPPRRPRREDKIQEDPPRRKPPRPRPRDEDDE